MYRTKDPNIHVKVISTDMPEYEEKDAAKEIAEALQVYDKEVEVAKAIKTYFDNNYGRAWNCIVGKHFSR